MKQVRVNVTTAANMAAIRHEKRNGRDVIIVPSATLPDGIIMNKIKYPADEIEKGFMTLNDTLAPFGHPRVNGDFVSASHPDGLAISYIGAHNINVRRENGRVLIDKIIDVEVASQSPNGKAVIEAINAGKPVHTSTGLLCSLDSPDGEDHEHIARNMYFDHDAILLNEEGAATPDQGVGMMVNAKGEHIDVINSTLEDSDRELDRAVDHLARAMERRERVPMLERMKTALLEAFSPAREPQQPHEKDLNMDKEQFDALSGKVNALTETAVTKEDLITAMAEAMKPLIDAQVEMTANAKAKDEAELAGYVAAIVKANILDAESAGELTINAARKLAEKAKPGTATNLNAALGDAPADEFADVDLNTNMKVA